MVRGGGGWVVEGREGVWGDGEGVWRVMRGEEGGGEVVERVEEACERERGGEEGGGNWGGFGKSGKIEKENGDTCVFVDAVLSSSGFCGVAAPGWGDERGL